MWFLLQPSEALHWKETKTPAVPLFFQMFPLHLRFKVCISESSKHLIPVASLSYRKIALKEIIRPTRINRSLLVSKAYLFQDFILLKIYYQLLGSLIIISPIWVYQTSYYYALLPTFILYFSLNTEHLQMLSVMLKTRKAVKAFLSGHVKNSQWGQRKVNILNTLINRILYR